MAFQEGLFQFVKPEPRIDDSTVKKYGKDYVLHAVEVLSALETMRQESTACDFVVKVGELEFPVHRAVLVACSKYFRAMIGSLMKESIEGMVELKDLEENSVRECINFMYSGDTSTLTQESAVEVLHTATVLQLEKLRTACFNFLIENISPSNCLNMLNLSDLYDEENLQTASQNYFKENFNLVVNSSEYLQLSKDEALMYMLEYGSSDDLVYAAAAAWIEWDIKTRKCDAIDFFNMLSLEEFPSQYLLNSFWKAEYFKESDLCKDEMCKCVFSDVIRFSEHLCMQNWFTLYSMAEYYEHAVQDIHDKICHFMLSNFTLIVNDNNFCKVTKKDAISMFKSPEAVFFSSQKLKWNAMLTWMNGNENAGSSVFCKLLESIELRRLSKRFLIDAMNNEPLIQEYPSSRKILEASFRQPSMLTEDDTLAFLSEDNNVDILHLQGQRWSPLHHTAIGNLQITTMNGHLCVIDGKDLYVCRKGVCIKQASLTNLPRESGTMIGLYDKLYLVYKSVYCAFDPLSNTWSEGNLLPPRFETRKPFAIGGRSKIFLIYSQVVDWISTNNRGIFEELNIPSEMDCQISDETSGALCGGNVYVIGRNQQSKKKIVKYSITTASWKMISITMEMSDNIKLFSFKNFLYAHDRPSPFTGADVFFKYNEEWDEWSRIMKNIPRRSMRLTNNIKAICSFTFSSK